MTKVKPKISKNAVQLARDIGLDASFAVEWQVRHDLTVKIIDCAKKNKLSVTEIASRSKTSRARITLILKGQSQGISIDVLLHVLAAVGQEVTLQFKKSA